MKPKLRVVFLFLAVFLNFLPVKTAAALVVNTPVVVDRSEIHSQEGTSFSVLNVGPPKLVEHLNSALNLSLKNLPIEKIETRIGMQSILNSAFFKVRGFTDELAPTPIPTSVLLLGSGLIGLIGIARRSLFTR